MIDCPVVNSAEAFDEIDFDSLEEEAGQVYTTTWCEVCSNTSWQIE
jgi:hypothetical protein